MWELVVLYKKLCVSSFVDKELRTAAFWAHLMPGQQFCTTRGQCYIIADAHNNWSLVKRRNGVSIYGKGRRQTPGLWKSSWVIGWRTVRKTSLRCMPLTFISLAIVLMAKSACIFSTRVKILQLKDPASRGKEKLCLKYLSPNHQTFRAVAKWRQWERAEIKRGKRKYRAHFVLCWAWGLQESIRKQQFL